MTERSDDAISLQQKRAMANFINSALVLPDVLELRLRAELVAEFGPDVLEMFDSDLPAAPAAPDESFANYLKCCFGVPGRDLAERLQSTGDTALVERAYALFCQGAKLRELEALLPPVAAAP